MPFPYVSSEKFEIELVYSAEDFGLSDGEWSSLLGDKLEQESERVEEYTGEKWRTDDSVPWLVRAAVIRLTRSVINQIEEDGLDSEKVGDHSEKYRPPSEIRAEVREELAEGGYKAEAGDLIRNSNRTVTLSGGSK